MAIHVGPAARLLLAATLLAGCNSLTGAGTGGQVMPLTGGDPVPLNPPDGQVVATGTVRDAEGAPVVDAVVFLVLEPTQEQMGAMEVGDVLPQVSLLAVTSGPDGTFTIRLGPHPAVIANAAADGGFVNLSLTAVERWPADDPGGMGFWTFPLTVTDAGFGDLPAPITLELMGG